MKTNWQENKDELRNSAWDRVWVPLRHFMRNLAWRQVREQIWRQVDDQIWEYLK